MKSQNKDRKTAGQLSIDLLKDPYPLDVIEAQRKMQSEHLDELLKCAKRHEEHIFPDGIKGSEKPFYVVVQYKRERLLSNTIRSYFYARRSRPIPDYDMSLYYYDPKGGDLIFVWIIPDRETVEDILENKLLLPKDHEQLYNFCKSFKENTLI